MLDLLALGHKGDVRCNRAQLSLQGKKTLIHRGAQDDSHPGAH
jgi:hypothetical protein